MSQQQQTVPDLFRHILWPPNSPGPNPVNYRIWGFDAGVCLQDSCRRRQSAETASHRLLVKSVSGHHRRRNWPV